MKLFRHFAFAMIIAPAAFTMAQTSPTPTLKPAQTTIPAQGTMMFEVNLKPFSGDEVISINQFQAKYRLSEQTALRLGVFIDNQTQKQSKEDYDVKEKQPFTTDEKSFVWGILPGIEYHFLKNSKISPYCGVELRYFKQNSSSVYEKYEYQYIGSSSSNYQYIKYDVDGGWISSLSGNNISLGQRAFHSYGANLLLGTDFYFIKNMYFGFEVGLSYQQIKFEKASISITNQIEKVTTPSYRSSVLNFYSNSAIRLGVWF